MSDDRGQAIVFAVFLIAIAAAVIVGVRDQQDRAFAVERARRAGEAAAEAATSAVADAYAAGLREAIVTKRRFDVSRVLAAGATQDAARAAASEVGHANGGGAIEAVAIGCGDGRVEVTVTAAGASYRAGFPAGECSRR